MNYKQSALYSILNNKCPRCHKGNFFEIKNPYLLKKFDKMYKHCPVCGEDFERETGFYYGAMFASYALTVLFGVTVFLIMCVLFNFDAMTYLVVFAILQILLMPLFYRLSRLLWINIFVRFRKSE